jgi:hypothetical protein
MTDPKRNNLENRLNKHPHLKGRIERLLEILENADGDVKKADEAEKLVMEELRKMGNEALHDWALNREEKEVEVIRKNKGLKNNGKKK